MICSTSRSSSTDRRSSNDRAASHEALGGLDAATGGKMESKCQVDTWRITPLGKFTILLANPSWRLSHLQICYYPNCSYQVGAILQVSTHWEHIHQRWDISVFDIILQHNFHILHVCCLCLGITRISLGTTSKHVVSLQSCGRQHVFGTNMVPACSARCPESTLAGFAERNIII